MNITSLHHDNIASNVFCSTLRPSDLPSSSLSSSSPSILLLYCGLLTLITDNIATLNLNPSQLSFLTPRCLLMSLSQADRMTKTTTSSPRSRKVSRVEEYVVEWRGDERRSEVCVGTSLSRQYNRVYFLYVEKETSVLRSSKHFVCHIDWGS